MADIVYREGDTIVACATPSGTGALAVVRLSGPRAAAVADRIFSGAIAPSRAAPKTVHLGAITSPSGEKIDEVLLTSFRAPHSFTGEDSIEISCHGAPFLVKRIVERAVAAGARPAAPGEFTRRAFLNGRIDLAQAESVADLVGARTAAAARTALRQLHGRLSGTLHRIRTSLIDVLAGVEANLDFVAEEGAPPFSPEEGARAALRVKEEIDRLLSRADEGRFVRDGVRLVIAGRQNSGKSTLFNALLDEERAIVSEEPGTTRDVIEGEFEEGGILFFVSDTAGVGGKVGGPVEREGIRRGARRRRTADLVLVTLDGSEPPGAEDEGLLDETAGRKRVVVVTKDDLPRRLGEVPLGHVETAIPVCAPENRGIAVLRETLRDAVSGDVGTGDPEVTSVRHIERLRAASKALAAAAKVTASGELFAEDLRAAAAALGEITGEGAREELLDAIFSRFCLGK